MNLSQFFPNSVIETDRRLLLHRPWLWETRIVPLAFLSSLLCVLAVILTGLQFGLTASLHSLSLKVTFGLCALIGLGYWLYQLNQFSAEQERGNLSTRMQQKRFGLHWLGAALLLAPYQVPDLLITLIWKRAADTAEPLSGLLIGSFCIAVFIDLWKQIGLKNLIYTLIANALVWVILALIFNMMNRIVAACLLLLSSAFIPFLLDQLFVATNGEFKRYKVMLSASLSLYIPILLFTLSFPLLVFFSDNILKASIPFSIYQLILSSTLMCGFLFIHFCLPKVHKRFRYFMHLPRNA